MKIRTGCDVEQIARFGELLKKTHFCQRVFTEAEREHIADIADVIRRQAVGEQMTFFVIERLEERIDQRRFIAIRRCSDDLRHRIHAADG